MAPGAAQQVEEQRLGLIVAGMSDGDHPRALLPGGAPQEAVPLRAGRGLEAVSGAPRGPGHVGSTHPQRDAEPLAEGLAEACVVRRVRAQAVVEVCRDQPRSSDLRERVEQRHRVRPTRQSHHQRFAADGRTGPRQRRSHGRDERAPRVVGHDQKPRMVAVQGFEPRTPRI